MRRSQEEAMRGPIAFFYAATLLSQTPLTQTEELRSPPMTAQDIAAGAKTFRSHCAECHGLNAEGGRGPNLAQGIFYHGSSDAALLKNISNGIPGTEMPGLFYSEDRIWQIIAYLRSLSDSQKGVAGDRSNGERLFRSSNCGECHRIQGNGGRMGPDLTHIGKIRSPQHLREAIINPGADVRQRYWVVDLVTDNGKSMSGFLMNEDTWSVQFIDLAGQLQSLPKSGLKNFKVEKTSKMPSYKDRFKGKELDDLVAYLSSLRPDKGDSK
jgi:putative heme-binding domain-containing protein